MKKFYVVLVFASLVTLPCYVQSQIPIQKPASATMDIYNGPALNSTTVNTDERQISFDGGVVYAFSNASWERCVAWGLPSQVSLTRGNISGACSYDVVNLSSVTANQAIFTGQTTFRIISGGNTSVPIDIRLVITAVDNSINPINIQQVGSYIYVPIPTRNFSFRIKVEIQALGPPGAVYFTSGTGTTGTSSYTCEDYTGDWVGAIQLYNCMATDPDYRICTTYPGTANNYQFILGTSTCGLTVANYSVTSETVEFCQDGRISFTVNAGSCSQWTAKLWNNNYSNALLTWPSSSGAAVDWQAISPAVYHVVIEDQAGNCAQNLLADINEGLPCSITFLNPDSSHSSPTSVEGCDDGSINVDYEAKVCGGPLAWNAILYDHLSNQINSFTPTPQGSAILWNNLTAGNYRIVVTSNSPCSNEEIVTVTDGPPCNVQVQNVQTEINGCLDNTITADIASLTCDDVWSAYLYNSDYSNVVQSVNSPNPNITFSNVALGTYHIVATDFANCKDTVNIVLTCSDGDPCTNDSCQGGCSHTYKCEDNNPCTEDFCQAGGICQNNPIICNDANPCTNDACVNGNCVATPINCADNNACTVDQCINGNCAHPPKVCNDSLTCTNDFCQGGNCIFQPICILNDNNPCTDDHCVNRTCLHVQKNCNDNNACTNDACSAGTCVNTPTCTLDDGNPCTTDQCLNGTCAHIPTDCNDNNSCTRDFCQSGGCVNEEICPVDDNDPCTTDQCVSGQCINTPVNCSDGNPCTADNCDTTGNCVFPPLCFDNDPCTTDSCNNGSCLYPQVNCNDFNSCTNDFCDSTGTCVNQPLCVLDDNNPCTIDICISGQCVNQPVNCSDGNLCTVDTCDANNNCTFPSICTDDGDPCTTDICVSGQCLFIPTDCDDSDLCTTDECDSLGGCSHEPSCIVDDGDNCTLDFCDNGVCRHQYSCACSADSTCDDNDLCTIDTCGITSTCGYAPAENCDDSNPCTNDYCNSNGDCVNDSLTCNDLDACTVDSCDNGSCGHSPLICNDSDLCTNDSCIGGFCIYDPIFCNDSIACTIDSCDNGNCVFEPVVCASDGDDCTNDTCISGACLSLPVDCDDNDLCTVDTCINGLCFHEPQLCPDEGDLCTSDFCLGGQCISEPVVCDDDDLCTEDTCNSLSGNCVFDPVVCASDGDPCTADTCIGGTCHNLTIVCNDSIACTIDNCVGGVCDFDPTCVFDDGDPCTTDTCISGGCIHIPLDCDDGVSCTDDFCDTLGNCHNDATCVINDGDPCTLDGCANGDCLHAPMNCNDNFDCTDDVCQNGICVYDTLCLFDDNDLCTTDLCIGGQCFHQDMFCNDGILCTTDSCFGGVCIFDPIICNDGNPCTTDSCLNSNCIYSPIIGCNDPCDVLVCTDLDPCTTDSCSNSSCFYPPLDCDDNNPCTTDSCDAGNCVNDTISNCNLIISGTVLTEIGAPVRSVTIKLTGSGNQTYTAGLSGQFSFNVVQGGNYTVTPSKANDTITNNGVSTLDLILIQRQILAVQSLGSPYKKIAADVNNSTTISTLDIILIRAVILQVSLTYPSGRLWAFVRSDFVFNDTLPPFPYDNFRSYSNISSNQTNQNFIGMKLGDVNNSWNPNVAKLETVGEVQFGLNDYNAMPGDEIVVPVRVKDFNKITGFQFTLSWNPEVLQLLEVNNKSLNGSFGMNYTGEGFLTTSWFDETTRDITLADDEAVFDLKFKVTGNVGSFSDITISSQLTETEAYNHNLDLLSIVPANGMVKVGDASGISNQVSNSYNLRVQPNPFGNSTNIIFSVPQDETVSIIIYDLLGKEIKHISGQFAAGQHSIEWTGDDDAGKALSHGLYHVRMLTANEASGVKVLLVR